MDIRDLIAATYRTLDYIIGLYIEHGSEYRDLTFHDLMKVANSISGNPNPPPDISTIQSALRLVEERGDDEARSAFHNLHVILNGMRGGRIEKENVPFWLQFFLSHPQISNQALTVFDERGFPVLAFRAVPEMLNSVEIDFENRAPIYSPHNPAPTFVVGDPVAGEVQWVVIPGAHRFPAVTPAQPPGTVIPLFIPRENWGNASLAFDSRRDETIAMRLVLEELGFYKTSAVFSQDVTIYNIGQNGGTFDMEGTGYRIVPLPKETWGRVLEPIANPIPNGPKFSFSRRLAVKPAIARKALENLLFMADTLKHIGLAMNSWDNLMVNFETGELSLGEADRPVLLNVNLFARALSPSSLREIVKERKEERPKLFSPYLTATMHFLIKGEKSLFQADFQLKEIIRRLSIVKNQVVTEYVEIQQADIVSQMMGELWLLARFLNKRNLNSALDHHADKIRRIIETYVGIHGDAGIVLFCTLALTSIIDNEKPEKWVEKTDEHILRLFRELLNNPELDPAQRIMAAEKYWMSHFEIKKGGSGGAAPQTPPDIIMGGLMDGGSGGPSVGQAAPITSANWQITAIESANYQEITAAHAPITAYTQTEDAGAIEESAEILDAEADYTLSGAFEAFGMAYDAFSAMPN